MPGSIRALWLAGIMLVASPAPAFERWTVIDGDTIALAVVEGRAVTRERLGLLEVDAPDLRSSCEAERIKAVAARDLLADHLFKARNIEVERIGRLDRFGRTLANITLDGVPLSAILLQAGLVRPYRGERRQGWC